MDSERNPAGERIRHLRTERGWSMRELAQRVGVSAATVCAVEKGATGVSLRRLEQYAHAFGMSPVDLLHTSPVPSTRRPDDGASGADWRTFTSLGLDAVTAAAITTFVDTGYHGSTMRTIAHRAGISLAGVYHYYPSKQLMLVTILDLTMDEVEWRTQAATDDGTDPLTRLRLQVEALALFHTLRADLAFIGSSEMRSLEEPERSRISARRSSVQHLIDGQIRAAVAEGSAHCAKPLETARAIVTMCTSLPQWFDISGPTSAAEIASQYSTLALRMIGATSG
ncbi:TetR family transcriptional regulator [Mycolicibacterium smegmatis]|uniref:Transcriptional regulator, TetR family protein n=1 Tax=Mycolicibacterium smegmatis (strain MKD8) TaxID=1214915 RepID=A0A2U9PR65_MYCSE|nr:TetR family transcriptional regulator [Mycolicibacterium smegmatis]AWT54299.1 transcriptional regulator, TetR family protein [Mycolicibacterium smegmatis MKD8]